MSEAQHEDLSELFRTYSKAVEDGDRDVGLACEDLVRMFDESAGDRDEFVRRLEAAASYSGWEPSRLHRPRR